MEVRPSVRLEEEKIKEIIKSARKFMRDNNNINQWTGDYPEKEVLNDIEKGHAFSIYHEDEICGYFAFIQGEDPTYKYIENGSWKYDMPYGTIHRIASSGKYKGILPAAIDFAFKKVDCIRIDTHEDNTNMQRALIKNGFEKSGTIFLANGDPRIAYERKK